MSSSNIRKIIGNINSAHDCKCSDTSFWEKKEERISLYGRLLYVVSIPLVACTVISPDVTRQNEDYAAKAFQDNLGVW